jgi:hypothetical protein
MCQVHPQSPTARAATVARAPDAALAPEPPARSQGPGAALAPDSAPDAFCAHPHPLHRVAHPAQASGLLTRQAPLQRYTGYPQAPVRAEQKRQTGPRALPRRAPAVRSDNASPHSPRLPVLTDAPTTLIPFLSLLLQQRCAPQDRARAAVTWNRPLREYAHRPPLYRMFATSASIPDPRRHGMHT